MITVTVTAPRGNTATSNPVTGNPATNPATGQRSAALKKCKAKYKTALKSKRAHNALTKPVKQHLTKQLKRCTKRASLLPV